MIIYFLLTFKINFLLLFSNRKFIVSTVNYISLPYPFSFLNDDDEDDDDDDDSTQNRNENLQSGEFLKGTRGEGG